MNYPIRFQPAAKRDLADVMEWYETQQAGLSVRFLASVNEALSRAEDNPKQFPVFFAAPEVRRILTDEFPYRIFFILEDAEIILLRILHSSRHDSHWRRHIPKR